MTTQQTLGLGAVVLFAVCIFVFWSRFQVPQETPSFKSSDIVITSASGTVFVHERDTDAETPATIGRYLHVGDTIRTGQGSEASLELFHTNRVALHEQTVLTIETARLEETETKKQDIALKIETGRIWSRIIKLLDLPTFYQVSFDNTVVTVRGTAFQLSTKEDGLIVDQFDGTSTITNTWTETGILSAGFSTYIDPFPQPKSFLTFPTADETRNDHWVRQQLRADEEFAKRVRSTVPAFHLAADQQHIGQEAGPFTLDQPGMTHSNYRSLQIVSRDQSLLTLEPGQRLVLAALALVDSPDIGPITRDVTKEATWQLSDPLLARMTQDGVLSAGDATGTLQLVARWNDGTHEHSATLSIPIRPASVNVDPNATLRIR